MWVVKLGGSLCTDPALPQWLEGLAQLGGGRVTIVPGGGSLADEVRALQAHWQFDDLQAHNMAVLAMAQNAHLMQALSPGLHLVSAETDIPRLLRQGKAVIWSPLEQLREQPDADTNWDTTSDSLALLLARRLNAERLLLVKACQVADVPLESLVLAGVLDASFSHQARGTDFPIDVLHSSQWDTARALLLGAAPQRRGASRA
jgi:5-(aminomethyl)-3-furanmethanol phosphate kinase